MNTLTMPKPKKYNVLWTCPHCGNEHNWWWEDEFEAFDDGVIDMVCDRCMTPSKCRGDGHGFYQPIEKVDPASSQKELEQRVSDLEHLEYDAYQYCRLLEDKLNEKSKLIFDSINSLLTRLRALEDSNVEKRVKDLEGLEELMNNRLLKVEKAIDDLDDVVEAPPSILELIHGVKPPFHERLREECGFTKETLDGGTIAKMVRFVAAEVEKMTERDMGGSFSVSNIEVARRLRELAADAQVEDHNYNTDEEDEGPGWGLYGFEDEDE